MSAAGRSGRRAVAASAALLMVASAPGIVACGGSDQARVRPQSAATASPATTATQTTTPATASKPRRARSARLTARERRQARRALKRLRKATPGTPPSVVSDSGVIP
jgi:hypothetical protein